MRFASLRPVLIAVILLLLPAIQEVKALNDERTRRTLKGLVGVHVIVEGFSEEQERAGFSKATFQTDVELKLRLAGIRVLSSNESFDALGSPVLHLVVTAIHVRAGAMDAFSVGLELFQDVRLVRTRELFRGAITWSVGTVGHGDISFVRQAVTDELNLFINAWLSVNPKK